MIQSSLHKQSGMGMLVVFYLIATFGLTLLLAFKVVPPYHENWYVEKALKKLAKNHPDDLQVLSKSTIANELSTFYTINGVRRPEVTKALEVERLREKTLIKINYEIRVPVVANIDAVVKFENVLDSSNPEACCSPKKESKYQ